MLLASSVSPVGVPVSKTPGLCPAMQFIGKRIISPKTNKVAAATFGTPGKIIGSIFALGGATLALKTLYDYIMDISDSTLNKTMYLGGAAVSWMIGLTSHILSNVAENYKPISPEERIKDDRFRKILFDKSISGILEKCSSPVNERSAEPDMTFSSIDDFISQIVFLIENKAVAFPHYSISVAKDNDFLYVEPLDGSSCIHYDEKTGHNYALRFIFKFSELENKLGPKLPVEAVVLAKKNSDTNFIEVKNSKYKTNIRDLQNWLGKKILSSPAEDFIQDELPVRKMSII